MKTKIKDALITLYGRLYKWSSSRAQKMANCCRFYCCRLSVVGCCCFCFSVCVAVVVNVGMTNAFRFKRASGQTMGHHAELSIQNRPQVACCPRPAAAATKTTTTTTLSSSESCVHRCRCRCLSDNAPEEGGESSGGGWRGQRWSPLRDEQIFILFSQVSHLAFQFCCFYLFLFVFFFFFFFFDLPQILWLHPVKICWSIRSFRFDSFRFRMC